MTTRQPKQKDTKAPTGAVGVSGARKKPTQVELLVANWGDVCLMVERGHRVREISAHFGVDIATINRVCRDHAELGQQYARAREASADAFEDEILRVSAEATPETYQQARLLADNLKWAAARRNFKRYGDKQAVEGDMNLNVIIKKS